MSNSDQVHPKKQPDGWTPDPDIEAYFDEMEESGEIRGEALAAVAIGEMAVRSQKACAGSSQPENTSSSPEIHPSFREAYESI